MINFLKETLNSLRAYGKKPEDVEFVSDGIDSITFEEFSKIADFEYDNGYGLQEINGILVIVGDNWWLERTEYDGLEWWSYKTRPKKIIKNHNRPFMATQKEKEEYVERLGF